MKIFIYKLVTLTSRVIYYLIPLELRRYIKKEQRNSNTLIKKLEDQKNQEIIEIFSEIQKRSFRFENISDNLTGKNQIQDYAIELALSNEQTKSSKENFYYLEFGVLKGKSANRLSRKIKKLYAFDSFFGICEDWQGTSPKGTDNLNGKLPTVNSNVELVVGKVQDTLDEFIKKHNPEINFIHFDMDTYGPTKFTFEKLKPYLTSGAVILFDQLYNYINWKEGEYKALKEVLMESEYSFKAFNMDGKQVIVQMN